MKFVQQMVFGFQFTDPALDLQAQQELYQALCVQKVECHRIMLSLTRDSTYGRLVVPQEHRERYDELFAKVLKIQKEINRIQGNISMLKREISCCTRPTKI